MALFKVENNFKTGRTTYRILGLKFSCVNPKLVIRPDYTPVISKIQNKYKNKEKNLAKSLKEAINKSEKEYELLAHNAFNSVQELNLENFVSKYIEIMDVEKKNKNV